MSEGCLEKNLDKLDARMLPMLRAGRIPGAALAVVAGGKTIYARGFGYRDLKAKKPMRPDTMYPIASTAKTMNTTLLGMLVEEQRLEWDAPVQRYLPQFRLRDVVISSRVTIRDLVTMRTGLPRHDGIWQGSTLGRAQMVERLAHLEPSADFRQRFQYNNLTVTIAGHIAEVVTGKSWEALVRERLFAPLGMRRTSAVRPRNDNHTLFYHESSRRRLLVTAYRPTQSIGPAGGSVYSTVSDMARWVSFNLEGGTVGRRRLIDAKSLAHIHAPQVIIGDKSLTGLPPHGAYALGWVVDHYQGHRRISHGGYLHNVNSSIVFFPDVGVGMVSFVNFGCSRLADLMNQYAFDTLLDLKPTQTFEQKLAAYEAEIDNTRKGNAAVARVTGTQPSHPLSEYSGKYQHAGYGELKIHRRGRRLIVQRNGLQVPLKHWHYDAWVAEDSDVWPIHQPHPYDPASPIQFHPDAHGAIAALSVTLEAAVPPIRFEKQ